AGGGETCSGEVLARARISSYWLSGMLTCCAAAARPPGARKTAASAAMHCHALDIARVLPHGRPPLPGGGRSSATAHPAGPWSAGEPPQGDDESRDRRRKACRSMRDCEG